MIKPIDWQLTLERLNGNEAMAKEILPMFFKELEELKKTINAAYLEKDDAQLYSHLHKLHGSCCFVGVPELKEATKQFAVAAKAKQHDAYLSLLTSFNQAADNVINAAQDFAFS